MTDSFYSIGIILVAGLVTILLRAFPFLLFGQGAKQPPLLDWLGKTLSSATIAMLVVYALAGNLGNLTADSAYGLPAIIATILTVGLHYKLQKPLLAVFAGTLCYMLLLHYFVPI